MKGKIKGLIIVILAIIAIVLPSRIVQAETLQERMNNLIVPEATYNTKLSEQYLKNNKTEENINPQNGEITFKQTDYSLPGRNGLDVNIERIYKCGVSKVWESQYEYINGVWVEKYGYCFETFLEDRYGLGKGNRFSFPTIEIKSNSDKTSYKFLHAENGETYRLSTPSIVNGIQTYTIQNSKLKDVIIQENSSYSNGQSDGTSKYVMVYKDGKKTYFSEDGRILGIVDRYNNKISFEYADLKYTYFGYHNAYDVKKRLISKIIDTLGREINIEYKEGEQQDDGSFLVNENTYSDFTVRIKLPDNNTITYFKSPDHVALREGYFCYFFTRLKSVQDTDYKFKYIFSYNSELDKDEILVNDGNLLLQLDKIDYCKSNLVKEFKYGDYNKRLIDNTPQKYKKIIEKSEYEKKSGHDLEDYVLELKNKVKYDYTNEPDGYGDSAYKEGDSAYLKDTYKYYSHETDLKGVNKKYTYNGNHELLNVEENGSDHKQITSFTYDQNKQINKKEVTIQDIFNGVVSDKKAKKIENYQYDEYGNLTSYTGPLATRDANGSPVNNEFTTNYTYATDRFNILTSKTWKKDANTTSKVEYAVDSKGNITQEKQTHKENGIDKPGVTDYAYDVYGNMIKKTVNGTYVTNYEYGTDDNGVNQNGGYLTKEYSIVNGNEISKKYCYDFNLGLLKREIDPNNNSKSIEYDRLSRVAKMTFPDNSQQVYEYLDSSYYDGAGNKLYKNKQIIYTDPNKNKYVYQYDIYGNLVEHDINDKVIKKISYDSEGNKIKEIDAKGSSIHYDYDSANRLIKKSFWENDNVEKKAMTLNYCNGYDANTPLLITETNEEGYVSKYYYDILNRLNKKETAPDKVNYYYKYNYSQNASYTYHGFDIPVSNGKSYTYSFDAYISQDTNIAGTGGTFIANGENGFGCSFYYDNTKKGTWQHFESTQVTTSNTARILMYPTTSQIPATTGYIMYKNIQFKETGSYNNLFLQPQKDSEFSVKGSGVFECVPINNIYKYNYSQNAPYTYHGFDIPVSNGKSYTYSFDAYISQDANIAATGGTFIANGENGFGCSFNYDNTKKGTWQHFESTQVTTSNTARILMYPTTSQIPATTGYIMYKNVQFKEKGSNNNLFLQPQNDGEFSVKGSGVFECTPINYISANYTYDYVSNKLSESDNKNNITYYTYDDLNRLVTNKDPLGNTKQYSYNAIGKTIEEKNAKNVSTYYDYDELGRVIRKKTPAADGTSAITRIVYDNVGNKIKEIAPNNYDAAKDTPQLVLSMDGISYAYDNMNRLISTTSAEGKVVEYRKYDANGNLAKTVDGIRYNGNMDTSKGKSFVYDAWGRVTQTTDALDNKEYYSYDLLGNLLEYTNANGKKTSYTYNSDGTLAQVKYADGGTIKYTYDRIGHKLSQEDQRENTTRYVYNGNGKVVEEYDPYNNKKSYKYDENGNLLEGRNYDDSVTYYTYDANNRLKEKKAPLEIDASKNVVYSTEAYDYDELGNIKHKVLSGTKDSTSKREINYSYYDNGSLNTTTTNGGAYTKNYYDKNGNVVKNETLKDTGAYDVTKNVYDKNNRVIKTISLVDEKDIYNAANIPNIANIRDNEYSGKVQLITGYEYDILGNVTKIIDPRAYNYLENDKTNRDKYSTVKTYDTLNRLEKVIWKYNDADVYKQYFYDAVGNKIKERNEKGNFTELTYDDLNRVKTIKDALGKTMTYEYDLSGNKTSETNAKNNKISYVYDKLNRLTTTIDPYEKVISEKVYDNKGNVVKAIDAKGYKSGTTNESRYGTIYTYDLANRLIKVVDPEIAALNDASKYKAKYEYNQYGEKTKEIDALGNGTNYEYDNLGKLIKVIDAKNIPTQYTYDSKGNKVSTIDGRNNTIKYVYGNQGIIVSSTNADNKTVSYQYDLALNKVKEVDRNGSIKLNTYDIRNLLLSKNIPSTGDSIEYSYDELGNRISMKDSTGTTSYNYNANNWITNVSKMGAVQVEYTYNDIGNVTSVKDKKENITNYEYDNCSRLSKVSYTVAGSAKSTSYSYDDNGNRNLITYSGGVKEEYAYDKNNKLLTLKNKKPDGSVISSYTYTYDLAGRQISKTDSYGTTNYSYDVLGRIERITAPGKTTAYAYDNVGNRIALNETYTSDQVSDYKNYDGNANITYNIKNSKYMYSKTNMLLVINESMKKVCNKIDKYIDDQVERSISYDYDDNGNEKKQTVKVAVEKVEVVPIIPKGPNDPNDPIVPTPNDPKHPIPIDPPPYEQEGIVNSVAVSNKVDIQGLRVGKMATSLELSDGSNKATSSSYNSIDIFIDSKQQEVFSTENEYDGFNRLKKSTLAKDSNTITTEYKYNGDDLRVKKVVTKVNNGVNSVDETNYLYDGQNVILETDAKDNVKVRYIKGINYIARIDNTNKLSYYLFNGHGDAVQTVSENGTVENQYDYDIFGNATLTVEAYSNAIRYGGEFFDADGGLYYLRSRYYDPYIGRFVTQDSFGGDDTNPLSLNLYTYCENDPINFLDPTGHYPEMVSYDPNNYNATVEYLQQVLNNHGYKLAVDGYFGQHTLDAVTDYQYNHTLQVDGIVGPQTWGSLLAAAPKPAPTPTPTPTASTNSGNSGSGGYVQYNPNTYNPEAARVQQILNDKGASLKVDGYFGDNTLAAVQKFQRDNGLDDDGIVGPKTWGMLLSSSSVYYGGSRSGGNNSRPAYEPDEGTGNTEIAIDDGMPQWLSDLIVGAGYSIDKNILFGAAFSIRGLSDKDLPNSTWVKIGRVIGDLASLVAGVGEFAIGSGGEVFGLTLDATGAGAIAGVPINIASGALVIDGAIVVNRSGRNLANDLLSFIRNDNKGGSKVNSWNTKGTWGEESLQKHFEKHGKEVGAESVDQYLRKAEAFKQNLKGAKTSKVDGAVEGVIRYKKLGKYIDLAPDGTIVSFGKQ